MAAVMRAADHPEGPTPLYFHWEDCISRAVLGKISSTGVLVCVPSVAAFTDALDEAESAGHTGVLGPYMEVSIAAVGSNGRPTKRMLDCLLFDLDTTGQARHLFRNCLQVSKPRTA